MAKSQPTKLNRADLLAKVLEIVKGHTNDPADELIKLGTALKEIGEALKGSSPQDAKAVLLSAATLLDVA